MGQDDGIPRLPFELLEQIVGELTLPCTYGDPVAARTLSACSLVSRAVRHCALQARFAVVVLPRHVRDFRRWIARSQREMTGYTQALFVALDDVSKLTSMSAGWDAELLRLLQQQGPHLMHLSLWTSETRALLRDPAQIRGPRVRASQPGIYTVAHVIKANAARRRSVARMLRHMNQGRLIQGDALRVIPLKADFSQRDEAQTRAEMAAAKERARQTLPNWLRNELASKEAADDVKRRYKAHLSADAREYQHEREAAQEAHRQLAEHDRSALEALHRQAQAVQLHDQDDRSDEEADVEIDWACMPLRLSICPSFPLHEHEEPLNFARLSIWTRLEELDVYVAVPAEVPRWLETISSLVGSPLIKFRFSSINASLLISLNPTAAKSTLNSFHQPEINLAGGLKAILNSEVMRSLLLDEFNDHRAPDVAMLERALAVTIASSRTAKIVKEEEEGQARQSQAVERPTPARKRDGLAASLNTGHTLSQQDKHNQAQDLVCVRILEGNQGHYGKLKDRRQDFLQRALALGPDCWSLHCF